MSNVPLRRASVFVAALAIATYANAIPNGFAFDDVPIVVENPLIRDPSSIGRILRSSYWARGDSARPTSDPRLYRPLTILSFAVDRSLWGLNSTAFHATNAVLHAATSGVVLAAGAEVLGSLSGATVAAAIFAVHPLHTDAVSSIVGRSEILATLFVVLAFRVLRRRSRLSIASVVAGAVLYLLGLLSKESAITLPALVAVDDWLHRDELPSDRRDTVRLLASRYMALAVAAVIFLWLRSNAIGPGDKIWPGFVGVSTLDRLLTASRVTMEYVGLFVFPRTLLADYWTTEVPIARSIVSPFVALSLVLWVVAAVIVIRGARRNAPLVFSVLWFFITLAPTSNVLFPIGIGKAERILYLPSVGLCFIAGLAFVALARRDRRKVFVRAAATAVVLAFGARTLIRNRDWHDNLTLSLATLRVSPASPVMNDIAAGELVQRGEPARALPLLRTALAQAPDMPLLRAHVGATFYRLGAIDSAIAAYRDAIQHNPRDVEAHNNLGVALLDRHLEADALAQFDSALAIDGGSADAHLNVGVIRLNRSQLQESTSEFSAALRTNPNSAIAHNDLGVALMRMRQRDRAAEEFRTALRLDPSYSTARQNLAQVTGAGR